MVAPAISVHYCNQFDIVLSFIFVGSGWEVQLSLITHLHLTRSLGDAGGSRSLA